MATTSTALGAGSGSHRLLPAHARPWRRVLGTALLSAICLPLMVGPVADPVSAQSPPSAEQARQRREEIKREQARVAAELEPLTATDDDLNKALQATNNRVRSQQARVSDAQRAADEAQQNADRLAGEQARLLAEVDQLKERVRDRAVSAYVNPQGKVGSEDLLLNSGDLGEAERKKEFVETVTAGSDDAVDQMRAVRQSLEQVRVESEAAASEARSRRASLDSELAAMKESQAQQAKVKAMIESRIHGYKREAAQLQAEDTNMQKVIADAQRRYQQQLAEAAQRRASAAASPAPASPAAPIASGGSPAANGGFRWPIAPRISQEFGGSHPGIDIVASMGTPVAASNGGVVISAGWNNGGYGNLVLIDHGGGIVTAYAHLSAVSVSAGTFLDSGTIIGAVGSTGHSTGPHLHFEVRVNGSVQNPRAYLR